MQLVEFLEAFGRVAEKAALPWVGLEKEYQEQMDMKKRESYPYCIKVEALLHRALTQLMSVSYRKYYGGPKDTLFTKIGDIVEED
jgi:hypothetical protein